MRVVTSVFAVLMLLPAAPALAGDNVTKPSELLIADQPMHADFQQARRTFETNMQEMIIELSDARNRHNAEAIAARYQLQADQFAEMVEARKAAGERLTGPYANPITIKALPENLRREIENRRYFASFSPRRSAQLTTEQYRDTGLVATPRDRSF